MAYPGVCVVADTATPDDPLGADEEDSDVCNGGVDATDADDPVDTDDEVSEVGAVAAGATGSDDPVDTDDGGSDACPWTELICPWAEFSSGAIAAWGNTAGRLTSSSATTASRVFW